MKYGFAIFEINETIYEHMAAGHTLYLRQQILHMRSILHMVKPYFIMVYVSLPDVKYFFKNR